ncbi:VOC family protein [Streptomyces sp. P17]|uniref:VOC family protein n=1 Tax=Streptomyces sp. P17 TaxID=3074716 RepID=UPI0028F3EC92|nr:VOC family protein [Streptomyces sp. P17]MDT9696456.1 hypothetical protein [Streptomyces sp. P17]
MDINCVIVDSADPDRLAAFWSELLDRPVVARFGPYVWLERKNGQPGAPALLADPAHGRGPERHHRRPRP